MRESYQSRGDLGFRRPDLPDIICFKLISGFLFKLHTYGYTFILEGLYDAKHICSEERYVLRSELIVYINNLTAHQPSVQNL